MKIMTIADPIYKAAIYIIPSYETDEIVKYFKKSYNIDYKVDNHCDAMHYSVEYKEAGTIDHFLIFKDFKNSVEWLAILSHEIYHLTHAVMREVGMILSEDSEEAFAYYGQYLMEQTLNKMV